MVVSIGAEIVEGERLREGRYYVVGGRVLFLVPSWATGRTMREGMIARQAVLLAIAAMGEEGALAAFAAAVSVLSSAA